MDTSVSDGHWGMQHHCIFTVATLITDVRFKQFLIRTAVQQGEHSRQRTVMDTSLSDTIEAHGTLLPYDAECMGSSVSQYCYLKIKNFQLE